MGIALIPTTIAVGGIVSAILILAAFWEPLSGPLRNMGTEFKRELDIADIPLRREQLGYAVLAAVTAIWGILVILTKPGPLEGLLELIVLGGSSLLVTRAYLRMRVARTTRAFTEQLESVLRMFAGAVRVGLGLRQALIHVAEQSENPARRELMRVVAATNLGISLVDALEDLANRMDAHETHMLVRVLRVQQQTGSDLAQALEGLADTIRDRRRFHRKVRAMTAQGRMSAWVLGLFPVVLALIVLGGQADLRETTFTSPVGQMGLGVAAGLDLLAVLVLLRITKVNA